MGVIFLCTCWGGWFYAAIKRWPHVEWPLVGIRLAEVWLHWTNFSLDSFILHPGAKTNKENEKKHNLKSIVIQFLFHKHLDGRSFLEGSVPTNPFNKSRVWAAVFHRSRFDYERKSSSHDSLPARRFGGRFGKVQFAKKKKTGPGWDTSVAITVSSLHPSSSNLTLHPLALSSGPVQLVMSEVTRGMMK